MGTVNFTVTKPGYTGLKSRSGVTYSSYIRTSDSYASSTSASFVEDGSGDILLIAGDIIRITASEPMWIRFGGQAATIGDGYYLAADGVIDVECGREEAGKVSVIDVS